MDTALPSYEIVALRRRVSDLARQIRILEAAKLIAEQQLEQAEDQLCPSVFANSVAAPCANATLVGAK